MLEKALGVTLAWWGIQGAGPAAPGQRAEGKITDLARAKRKAVRIVRRLSHYALAPIGLARRSLGGWIER